MAPGRSVLIANRVRTVATKQETLRLLREEAAQSVVARRYAPALEAYAKLEALQPGEAEWPKRAADCYAALKKPKEQAEALARAAERFEQARLLKKAEALCKLSLGVDPGNARARALLTELERMHQQMHTIAPPPMAFEATPQQAIRDAPALTRRRLDVALRERRATLAPPRSQSSAPGASRLETLRAPVSKRRRG